MEKPSTNKVMHFVDEIVTLAFTAVGVLLSDYLQKPHLENSLPQFTTTQIIISIIISIMTYGAMFSNFKYDEGKVKLPFLVRAGIAISQGVTWRVFTNVGGESS
jgi:ACR3 family arsenite efflux pump ArsB